MQGVRLTDAEWRQLLALRDGLMTASAAAVSAAAHPLYGRLAKAVSPFVLAQVGQSLDGRVATLSGDAQDVSGADGIAHLHRCRALVDAVVVGVGTVVADNPSLSVRAVEGKSPVRVVIDCNGRMPRDAKMLQDGGAPVIVMQADDVVRSGPFETCPLPRHGDGGFLPSAIVAALHARGLGRILVEGGATTISRFIEDNAIDRLHVSISPIIIGSGPSGIRLPPIDKLSEAMRPKVEAYNIGSDIVFDCDLRAQAAPPVVSRCPDRSVELAGTD
jgi:diaminohydroxyphosphoribosylaminopyrimidine deaminase / 5-amino-6-(5-phosphoribosylamino)uracil reductase